MKSATHSWFGAVAVKSRSTRSAGPASPLGRRSWCGTASPRSAPAQPCSPSAARRCTGPRRGPAAQLQPHLAGTEPARNRCSRAVGDQRDDLGVAQRPLRRPPGAGLVVGATGRSCTPCSVSTVQIGSTPNALAVLVDEVDSEPVWAVELRREESRRRLQDLVGPPQLGDLLLQLPDLGDLLAGLARPGRRRRPRPGAPTCAASPASRSPACPRSTGSPRTRSDSRASTPPPSGPRAPATHADTSRDVPWTSSFQRMKSPDIPGRFKVFVGCAEPEGAVGGEDSGLAVGASNACLCVDEVAVVGQGRLAGDSDVVGEPGSVQREGRVVVEGRVVEGDGSSAKSGCGAGGAGSEAAQPAVQDGPDRGGRDPVVEGGGVVTGTWSGRRPRPWRAGGTGARRVRRMPGPPQEPDAGCRRVSMKERMATRRQSSTRPPGGRRRRRGAAEPAGTCPAGCG